MNIRRFKLVLILCMIALFSFVCGQALAALQAQVDRNPVAANETFNLTLQTAESTSGDPDLSVLKKDFDVLGQNKSSSLQIFNGQASRNTR
ncbi:MAG TPA: BatD family protein, partial [Burkholderiaceae bacterium]|nr:BatD family protein [Burkholderiaceae bacterium]